MLVGAVVVLELRSLNTAGGTEFENFMFKGLAIRWREIEDDCLGLPLLCNLRLKCSDSIAIAVIDGQ